MYKTFLDELNNDLDGDAVAEIVDDVLYVTPRYDARHVLAHLPKAGTIHRDGVDEGVLLGVMLAQHVWPRHLRQLAGILHFWVFNNIDADVLTQVVIQAVQVYQAGGDPVARLTSLDDTQPSTPTETM